MIIWSTLLLGCLGQTETSEENGINLGDVDFEDLDYDFSQIVFADTSVEAALGLCQGFYDGIANVTYLGEGAQSIVYKCSSADRNVTVADVALKMYKTPIRMDLPRREIIDTAMGQLGFGAVVYGFNYDPANFTCNAWEPDCGTKEAGKFEEFISGRNIDYTEVADPAYQNVVAKKMAQLHTASESDVPVDTTAYQTSMWPWNTKLVYQHLTQDFYNAAYAGADEAIIADPYPALNIENANDFSQFCQDLVDNTDGPIVFCHNDAHPGNIMIKDGNETLEDRLIFVDYDQAGFGYRAFDLLYFIKNWPVFPTNEEMMPFLQVYLDEYNTLSSITYTMDQLVNEINCHKPFLLFQTIIFYATIFPGNTFSESLLIGLEEVTTQYAEGKITCGRNLYPAGDSADNLGDNSAANLAGFATIFSVLSVLMFMF